MSRPRCPGAIQSGIAMVWLPSSKLNSFRTKTGQIGIGCSRTRKCSQRYEIDHFWPWFFSGVQPLKFFLNPIREPAVSFNPTSQLLLKLRCGSTDVIWKYLSLLGFATGIIFSNTMWHPNTLLCWINICNLTWTPNYFAPLRCNVPTKHYKPYSQLLLSSSPA